MDGKMGLVDKLLRGHRSTGILALTLLGAAAAFAQTGPLESGSAEATTRPAVVATAEEPPSLPDAPTPALNLNPPAGDQADSDVPLQDIPHPQVTYISVAKHFVPDELHLFSSPAYIRSRDLKWLVPLAGATAVALSTDHYTMSQVVSRDPTFNNNNNTVSDVLRNTFIGVPVGFAGLGQITHDDHLRESGLLGGQAMIDAYAFDEVIKLSSWRERPNVDNGRGRFFVGSAGVNSSFFSGHTVIAWSSAAVLAGEYPSAWHEAAIYSLATGVSLTRVLAQQHFPTDVLVGSAAGWLIGHYVFRAHHHALIGKGILTHTH
ncbi:MAG TPA: phosphatase PAP2 family protein [Acidobacteriaceae bacterium]